MRIRVRDIRGAGRRCALRISSA